MLCFATPICLSAMDQLLEKDDLHSIIALNVFDNNFQMPLCPRRIMRESLLFAQNEVYENPLAITKKQFEDCLRRNDADRVFFLLEHSFVLTQECSLARKMSNVFCDKSTGFELAPREDYEEEVVPRECIIKTCLLLACKKKNKNFLSEYRQKHGVLSLHRNIGNSFYEEVYGATALKNIIGKDAYNEYKLGQYIHEHLKKFNLLFSDELLDVEED
jgi:hypothetical protein